MTSAEARIAAGFQAAGCDVSMHVLDLGTEKQIAIHADAPVILASVFKVLVALEFYAQAEAGAIDPTMTLALLPDGFTAGPTGVSMFEDPVRISLRDLCGLMMSVSDNTATDVLMRQVGLDRINARAQACGCRSTVIESDLKTLFDGLAVDVGFRDYAELARARLGALGEEALHRSAQVDASAAFDPTRTNRSTAADMTRLLALIWRNEAASPQTCAKVREVMARQVSTRIGRTLPDAANLAAKTGSLTGRVRNEIGVVTHADGRQFAAAVFTRAHRPFEMVSEIEARMGTGIAEAIDELRRAG